MITDIVSYLSFFESVRGRTERDVAALPPAAVDWTPPAFEGEAGWTIGQIVGHIGASRLYFASAFRDEGWLWEEAAMDRATSRRGCRGSRRPRRASSRFSGTRRTRGSHAGSR